MRDFMYIYMCTYRGHNIPCVVYTRRRKTGSDETISMFKPHHHTRSIYACDHHRRRRPFVYCIIIWPSTTTTIYYYYMIQFTRLGCPSLSSSRFVLGATSACKEIERVSLAVRWFQMDFITTERRCDCSLSYILLSSSINSFALWNHRANAKNKGFERVLFGSII